MANIPEPVNPGFPAVYEIAVDDDVIGGPGGTANRQAAGLVERTAFLNSRIVPPGTIIQTFIRSAAVRAQKRLLDLSYQIISITGTYAALAANVYCGDALNATEPCFYKCDASGNRTTSGAYMKMPDCRGLFLRGAGANSVYKGANDTPYDGKSIGTFIADAIRNITGHIESGDVNVNYWNILGQRGVIFPSIFGDSSYCAVLEAVAQVNQMIGFNLDVSRQVPTSHENRPASISAMVCITY
jgi:hypothetical protein